MKKLYPVVTPSTGHLFIDPSLFKPYAINQEGYGKGEKTSFIKPGKVLNLMELCKPDNKTFTVTEEPDINTLSITEIIFGMFDRANVWTVCHVKDLDIKLSHTSPAKSVIDGPLVIGTESVTDGIFIGDRVDLEPNTTFMININLTYSRGSRCLEYSNNGGYYTGKPQILGLKFNLDHKDSKIV